MNFIDVDFELQIVPNSNCSYSCLGQRSNNFLHNHWP